MSLRIESEIRNLLARWPLPLKIRVLSLLPFFVFPPAVAIILGAWGIYKENFSQLDRRSVDISLLIAAANITLSIMLLQMIGGILLEGIKDFMQFGIPFFQSQPNSAPSGITISL